MVPPSAPRRKGAHRAPGFGAEDAVGDPEPQALDEDLGPLAAPTDHQQWLFRFKALLTSDVSCWRVNGFPRKHSSPSSSANRRTSVAPEMKMMGGGVSWARSRSTTS